jgi:hypothetical protein
LHFALAAAVLLATAACHENTPTAGGQTGGVQSGCLPVDTMALDPTDESPLGFSAIDTLTAIGETQSGMLTWASGVTTGVTVTVSPDDGPVEYLDREWRSDNDADVQPVGDPGDCTDVVAIPLALGFKTVDGAFDEVWRAELLAETAASASFATNFDPAALHGGYVVTEVDATAFDSLTLRIQVDFVSGVAHGGLSGQGTTSPNEGAVSAQNFDIAAF